MKKFFSHNIYKIYALILFLTFFVRYMLGSNVIEDTIMSESANPAAALFGMLGIWFVILAVLIFVFNAFYDLKILKVLMFSYVAPFSVLNIIFIKNTLSNIVADFSSARGVLFIIEAALLLIGTVIYVIKNRPPVLDRKYIGVTILSIIIMLLFTMPTYTLLFFLGVGEFVKKTELSFFHRLYIYVGFLAPLLIYFAIKNKDYKFKEFVVLFIGVSTLITFLNKFLFSDFHNITNLPLHLCHTAMYISPLCIIFKLKKFFYFTYFINVLGAFIAILIPSSVEYSYLWEPSIILFFVNHWTAFYLPFLAIAIGVFKRPKWPEFKLAIAGFSIYFFTILFIDAWFTNYNPDVDYFFLNTDYVVENLGKSFEDLRLFTITFNIGNLKFVLYPVYQSVFYAVYIAASFGMWFLYENCYTVTDNLKLLHANLKKIKLEQLALESRLNGRSINEPINADGVNMIAIKNFSKKYGSSEVFAVKEANLQINAGEIFGFLGPNGAGKSTIIKSIVGIQPLTSGAIEVCGYDIEKQSVEAKMQIGFVPDHYALYEKLTGREYINYIADLYEVTTEDRDTRIENFLNIFELHNAFDNQIKTYSHGMKQKIAIMAALVHNPKVWILDEPLTGLDPTSIFQVKETMKSHAKAGNIVFFSSHIIDVVEKICDRIAIIKGGKILIDRSVKDLENAGIKLEDLYMETIGEKDKGVGIINTKAGTASETQA